MERRDFLKAILMAPAIGVINTIVPEKEKEKLPKALLVDPYQVNLPDLRDIQELDGVKIIRLRRPRWGIGFPMEKIY